VKLTPGVNHQHFMQNFYPCRFQKCKVDKQLDCIFALLGSACMKAVRKILVKLTPDRPNQVCEVCNDWLKRIGWELRSCEKLSRRLWSIQCTASWKNAVIKNITKIWKFQLEKNQSLIIKNQGEVWFNTFIVCPPPCGQFHQCSTSSFFCAKIPKAQKRLTISLSFLLFWYMCA